MYVHNAYVRNSSSETIFCAFDVYVIREDFRVRGAAGFLRAADAGEIIGSIKFCALRARAR